MPRGAYRRLISLMRQGLMLVLGPVIDREVAEHRFHIAAHSPVFHIQLRIYCEFTLLDIEAAEREEQVVHRGHVGILNRDVHVKPRPLLLGQEVSIDGSVATTHELTAKTYVRRSLLFMIGIVGEN